MAEDTDREEKDPREGNEAEKPVRSPYGPHHGQVDQAAGGADSSPFETMSSDERDAALKKANREGQP